MTTPTTATRFHLYRAPHKGVRRLTFETTLLVGATDFGDTGQARRASDAIARLVRLSEDHMQNEDRVVMPILERVAPAVHRTLQEQHDEHAAAFEEIRALGRRVTEGAALERWAAGERLYRVLQEYVARDLDHMAIEESLAMEALWSNFTDAELLAIEHEIVSRIPPETMAEFGAYMLPALSVPERAPLLAGLGAAPPEVFAAITAPARTALGEAEWHASLEAARVFAAEQRAAA